MSDDVEPELSPAGETAADQWALEEDRFLPPELRQRTEAPLPDGPDPVDCGQERMVRPKGDHVPSGTAVRSAGAAVGRALRTPSVLFLPKRSAKAVLYADYFGHESRYDEQRDLELAAADERRVAALDAQQRAKAERAEARAAGGPPTTSHEEWAAALRDRFATENPTVGGIELKGGERALQVFREHQVEVTRTARELHDGRDVNLDVVEWQVARSHRSRSPLGYLIGVRAPAMAIDAERHGRDGGDAHRQERWRLYRLYVAGGQLPAPPRCTNPNGCPVPAAVKEWRSTGRPTFQTECEPCRSWKDRNETERPRREIERAAYRRGDL